MMSGCAGNPPSSAHTPLGRKEVTPIKRAEIIVTTKNFRIGEDPVYKLELT
jgi:hypothetical protein